MNHLPNEDSRRPEGGDKRSPAAKVDIAKREEQIVARRLRGFTFSEIGETVGVSKQAAVKAFQKALRRNTDFDIQIHHRSELAKLDLEEANVWRVMDANKDKPKVQFDGTAQFDVVDGAKSASWKLAATFTRGCRRELLSNRPESSAR